MDAAKAPFSHRPVLQFKTVPPSKDLALITYVQTQIFCNGCLGSVECSIQYTFKTSDIFGVIRTCPCPQSE